MGIVLLHTVQKPCHVTIKARIEAQTFTRQFSMQQYQLAINQESMPFLLSKPQISCHWIAGSTTYLSPSPCYNLRQNDPSNTRGILQLAADVIRPIDGHCRQRQCWNAHHFHCRQPSWSQWNLIKEMRDYDWRTHCWWPPNDTMQFRSKAACSMNVIAQWRDVTWLDLNDVT